jgi:hypothetical protein
VNTARDRRSGRPGKARGRQPHGTRADQVPPPARTRRLRSIFGLILVGVLALTVVGFRSTLAMAGDQLAARFRSATTPNTAQTPAPHISPPLIFGTNIALYDSRDQLLNSLASQHLLKQAEVPIIRMPFRSQSGDVDELKALRAIQYIGAIPIVIVHGPTDPNALADDSRLIEVVRNVFGNEPVYVEFGNEPDLAGVDAQGYAASWNTVIPSLKALAPTYRFIGPATSLADPGFVATFDKAADPRPDANTWHEYVCKPSSSDEYCLAHLADWTAHIQQINTAVRAAIGTTVPLMITEWNIDANVDPRLEDQSFMRAWTARALQTLADNTTNGLIAALQYCVASNWKFNLIDSTNSLTPEGQVFFQTLAGITSRAVTSQ